MCVCVCVCVRVCVRVRVQSRTCSLLRVAPACTRNVNCERPHIVNIISLGVTYCNGSFGYYAVVGHTPSLSIIYKEGARFAPSLYGNHPLGSSSDRMYHL